MYLADYHTHSKYSYDGKEDITQMCEKAVKAGLSEIAITDHVDIYSGLDYGLLKNFDVTQDEPPYRFGTAEDPMFGGVPEKTDRDFSRQDQADGAEKKMTEVSRRASDSDCKLETDLRPYLLSDGHYLVNIPGGSTEMPFGRLFTMDIDSLYAEIARAAEAFEGRLRVRAGAELGQPLVNPGAAEAFLGEIPLDFVIGSIHNMDYDLDVYYYDFSTLDMEAVYSSYLDRLIETARLADFDVLGHITYPLRYMYEREHYRPDLRKYRDRFAALFDILIQRGRGIELNVSGLDRAMRDTMPPMEVLKLYRQRGGEIITIGSDAHSLEYIGAHQIDGQEMLREAGFRYITVFDKRKPEFVPMG